MAAASTLRGGAATADPPNIAWRSDLRISLKSRPRLVPFKIDETVISIDEQPLSGWERALLPAVEGGPGPGRSLRDWVVDLAAVAAALVVAGADVVAHHHTMRGVPFDVWLGGAFALLACAVLWTRRAHPLAVGLTTGLISGPVSAARGAALVGLFTVAVHCGTRWTWRLAMLSIASGVLNAAIVRPGNHYDWRALEATIVLSVAVVGYGLYVRLRRQHVLTLRERAERLQAEHEHRVNEARQSERLRIAREMHDVLAHRISLLSVHAGALEYSPDAPADELAQAASVIRRSARAAQEDLRAVIGVLRDADRSPAEVERPQPTLADVRELIAESQRAGMQLTCALDLPFDDLPQPLARTIYRIIQETLTNARKHAPGQPVSVAVGAERTCTITVTVHNRPAVGHELEPAPHGAQNPESTGSGSGLVGLNERVHLAGGELRAYPLPGGGFAVDATLPWSRGATP
jgi:signal transduction histidine kinase